MMATTKPKRKTTTKRGAPRIGTAKPKRASQRLRTIANGTRTKTPSARLVKRRKANTRAGYFPNPLNSIVIQCRSGTGWKTIGTAANQADAVKLARGYADTFKTEVRLAKRV